MKTLLVYLLTIFFCFNQDKVIICKGPDAYAYHSYECSGLKQCRYAIETVTLKEALSLRRKPCGNCYDNSSPSPTIPTSKSQCSATTKKGKQCSRKARSNGYCWQHG